MAVITATAAAGTALTATTIAAGVGAATAAVGTGLSFSQAAKQRKVADTAAAKSDVLMKKARDQATKDQYAALRVPLDVYDRQIEQTTQGQTDLIAGLAEGDSRNLAAGVGRVGALGVDAAESTRIAKADAIYDNETMKANSRADIDQQLIGMDVGEAGRQNELAINANKARNANIRQGYSSVGKLPGALAPLVPLFSDGVVTPDPNTVDPNAGVDPNATAGVTNPPPIGGAGLDAQMQAANLGVTLQELMDAQTLAAQQGGNFMDYLPTNK